MNDQATACAAPISQQSYDSSPKQSDKGNCSYALYLGIATLAVVGLMSLIGKVSAGSDLVTDAQNFSATDRLAIMLGVFAMFAGILTCFVGMGEFLSSLWNLKPLRLGKAVLGISLVVVPVLVDANRPTPNQLKSRDLNNLRQLGLAMLNYESKHLYFPPVRGATCSTKKEVKGKGLSWRVHILPFLDCDELYERFHLDEPWDSPHNLSLIPEMPEFFQSHSADVTVPAGKTLYLRPVGNGALASGDLTRVGYGGITDGSSYTIMLLQVKPSAPVEWTRPLDYHFDPDNPKLALGNLNYKHIPVILCDGSTHCLSMDLSNEDLKALITCSGGEDVDVSDVY